MSEVSPDAASEIGDFTADVALSTLRHIDEVLALIAGTIDPQISDKSDNLKATIRTAALATIGIRLAGKGLEISLIHGGRDKGEMLLVSFVRMVTDMLQIEVGRASEHATRAWWAAEEAAKR